MRKFIWVGAAIVALGFGVASCSDTSSILGCYNPTGYCGSNTPDPDRIGGPSWFLWQASAEDRMTYYRNVCSKNTEPSSSQEITSCAVERIRENAHHYCVLYYLPPTRPKDEAEEAERESNYESCKRDVLVQHSL